MTYFTLSGSNMISILIPMCLLQGDIIYTLKIYGWTKERIQKLNTCMICVSNIFSIYLVQKNLDPYIPFSISFGSIIFTIVNTWIYRDQKKEHTPLIFAWVKIFLGIIIIIIPHLMFFKIRVLSGTIVEVKYLCYLIYSLWGGWKIFVSCYCLIFEHR